MTIEQTEALTAVDKHVEEARILTVVFGVQLGAVQHPRHLLLRVHVALTQTSLVRLSTSPTTSCHGVARISNVSDKTTISLLA